MTTKPKATKATKVSKAAKSTAKRSDAADRIMDAIKPTKEHQEYLRRQKEIGETPHVLTKRQFKVIVHALMELTQAVDCLRAEIRGEGIQEIAGAVDGLETDVSELANMPFDKLAGTIHRWFYTYEAPPAKGE